MEKIITSTSAYAEIYEANSPINFIINICLREFSINILKSSKFIRNDFLSGLCYSHLSTKVKARRKNYCEKYIYPAL